VREIHRLCVFCGSSIGHRAAFATAARTVGHLVASEGMTLVYGGAQVGLMGILADAALAAGGEVVGVIPGDLLAQEIGHERLTELHVTASIAERKARMAELADAFLVLPGGLGTLEEAFEMATRTQVGLSTAPVGLLDVDGFFAPLLAYLDHAQAEGLIAARSRAIIRSGTDPVALLDQLRR